MPNFWDGDIQRNELRNLWKECISPWEMFVLNMNMPGYMEIFPCECEALCECEDS